jgi:hypothetical protein
MRCLCYAKFPSSGTIPPSEFFAHIGTIWSYIEDNTKTTIKTSNLGLTRNNQFPVSIVFITDCKSLEQLSSDLARMPCAGISNVEVFPMPGKKEFQ